MGNKFSKYFVIIILLFSIIQAYYSIISLMPDEKRSEGKALSRYICLSPKYTSSDSEFLARAKLAQYPNEIAKEYEDSVENAFSISMAKRDYSTKMIGISAIIFVFSLLSLASARK